MTERNTIQADLSLPGPQDYAISTSLLAKKDFSRPRFVLASPTRNTDGAFRKNPDLASNELKHVQISPGPVPSLDQPGARTERQRTEPRMRQYGLNMITNTLPDPEKLKTNNEVAKAALKKRLQNFSPGPGEYSLEKQRGKNESIDLPELKRGRDYSLGKSE